jgi:outer membrane protein assembly factor BamB
MPRFSSALALSVLSFCVSSAPAGDVIGWRTDGTGSYPKAQPPLEWSPTKHVVWKTPMPKPSNSLPVLLGQRLFICADPGTLQCFDREDGKLIWQKNSNYDELEISDEVRKQFEAEVAEVKERKKKQSAIHKEMDQLHRMLIKDKAAKEEIEAKIKPFRKQIDELEKEIRKFLVAERYTMPPTHGDAGYSTPTPLTDGKHVWVAFGSGLMACFDLEGNRKWLKLIEHSNAAFAHSGSPILAGGHLVIHYTDLVALNPKTGEEVWRVKRPTKHGTPTVARVDDTDVIFTPNGTMVRADTGKVLAEGLGHCGANSPILHEGCVYWVSNQVNAIRLPTSLKEPVKPEKLWKASIKFGGYGFSSPVIHDGLLYAANDQGILSVLDIKDGKLVYEERLNHDGTTYPSISVAGNRIYVSSDRGTMLVLQPGREYKELARNKLEPFRSSLVFDGKRLYLRTHKNLYCIGE